LPDDFGAELIAPAAPTVFVPGDRVIADRVVTVRRQRSADIRSSFTTLYDVVRAGCVVLVEAGPQAGAAFGSNLALAAAGAQALVTNGAARDSTRLAMLGLPYGCAGWTPVGPRTAR
jgi:regulator of RNase E activity RraA